MHIAESELRRAAQTIKSGGIVAFPTETVYGLGADAFNARAVARIFEVKQRPAFDPLIVHIHEKSQLQQIAEEIPQSAVMLIERLWPGPLTIVVRKKKCVPDIVTAGLPNVGIRMPGNSDALALIKEAGVPIAAPSANKFGYVSPTCAEHVREQLEDSIDMVLDGGSCNVGVESTIVSFAHGKPLLLRSGGLPVEEIETVIGPLCYPERDTMENASPGRALRHYAPLTPVVIGYSSGPSTGLRKGLLAFSGKSLENTHDYCSVEVLSENGDLSEAACNLFAALRRLDKLKLDVIETASVPSHGLGLAINDRLKRAAQRRS
jgi:L-threonylcarbamoyladenylate synthase